MAEETAVKPALGDFPVAEEQEKAVKAVAVEVDQAEKEKEEEKKEAAIEQSVSFKEETNVVGDLPDPQKKALEELKVLIRDALDKRVFVTVPPPPAPPVAVGVEEPKIVAAEEGKVEEVKAPAPVVVEEVKPEAEAKVPAPAPVEEVKPEAEAKVPAPAPVEEVKPEAEAEVPAPAPVEVEEVKPEPVAEETAKVVVVESEAVVDEDGAKTVEAIEETIVAVSPPAPVPFQEEKEEEQKEVESMPEEVSIWGVPLLADERSDVILLKFLRARDFKVKEAFNMIQHTVRWRKEFKIDELLEVDLGNTAELEKVVFMKGFDKEGHPVCYNVYGEFQNKDLYNNTLSDEEKRLNFLRWRIQFLEKSIRKLDFSPNGISTIVQVNDLKNSPGPTKKELRLATNQALQLLQDNYPEFVAKQVFINVPWWYLAFNRMMSPFLTQRTKSKFVFAGPSRTADTLFKYIAPEQVPIQYGGLSGDQETFTTADAVTEVVIKPASKHTIEIPFTQAGSLVWELRVVGWEVTYGAEFVPTAADSYTVIVQKTRKISPTDEPVISNTFKVGEPGTVILTIDNQSSKKKKLIYRSKTNTASE